MEKGCDAVNPANFLHNCQVKIRKWFFLWCLRDYEKAIDEPFSAIASAKIDCIRFLMEGDQHDS